MSKGLISQIANNSGDVVSFQKDIGKTIRELSLVLEACHYMSSIQEVKDFLEL